MLILFLSLLWNPSYCLPVSDEVHTVAFSGIPDTRDFYNFENIYGPRVLPNPLTFGTDEPRDQIELTSDSKDNIRDSLGNDSYQKKSESVSTEDVKDSPADAHYEAEITFDPMDDIKDSLDTILLFLHGIRDLLDNKSTDASDSLSPIAAQITVLGQNLLSSLLNSSQPCDQVTPDAEIIVWLPKPEDSEDVSQTLSTESDNSQDVSVPKALPSEPKVAEDFSLPDVVAQESKVFRISKEFSPEPVVSEDFNLPKILAPRPEDYSNSNLDGSDTVILVPVDDEENTESPLLDALLNNHQKKAHSHDKKIPSDENEKPDDDDSDISLRKKLAKLLWSAVNNEI